jgi:hypothetical protein
MAIVFDVDRPLPESAQKDIEAVVKNSGKLLDILQSFSSRTPEFSPAPVFEMIARELSMTYSDVSKIFSAIETLSDINHSVGGIDQLTSLLTKRLTPERAQEVATNKDSIRTLLDMYNKDHPLALSMKAEKLSYLHQNLYQDGEIITDARPIFDSDGVKVIEFVIMHSFVLNHYSYGSSGKRTHFAMDSIDVLRLRDACDRAIKKATNLKAALGEKWTVKILNDRGDGV